MKENSKSSVENHSKGEGGAFQSDQGMMGSEYDQAHNDKMAAKQTGICSKAFKETMTSRKPTQGG